MSFPVDGSNHWGGVKAELTFQKYIPNLELIYGKKIIEIIHKGGTKVKTDICIVFESGEIKNISLKKKKSITSGSFDYANTTNFFKNSFPKTKEIIKKYKCTEDSTFKSKFEECVHLEIKKMKNEEITNLFNENVIKKYNKEKSELIILDEKTNMLYPIKPLVFELINQGYLLSLCDSTRGKTSSKLICISPNGVKLDLGLRIRVHLNNGYSKLINKNDGNSSLCIKFQQDSVRKLINFNSNEI
jgi:hypothetical protein